MGMNYGKKFEQKFKEDWGKTMPNSSFDRLVDTMNGYKYISNISDFICYKYPNIFYLETKSHYGNTFPLTNLTQYEKLKDKWEQKIKGTRIGAIIWFIDHDRVLYVPISTIVKMKENNKKSINIKTIDQEDYYVVNIPSIKKRMFMDSDYSVLINLEEGN